MTPDSRALALAVRQGGVITRIQAFECGLSNDSIYRRVRKGGWIRISRSVYRLIDMASPHDLLRAAITSLPGAVVSHESAAEIHEIPFVRRGEAVVSVHTRTTHVFPGVTVHRNHDLAGDHTEEIDGMPVTALPRTVLDLSSLLGERHVRAIVDRLIAEERVSVAGLRRIHDEVARRGKPGSTALRRVIAERGEGAVSNATRLELDGLAVIRDGGLHDPILEYPFPWNPGKRFDAAYPDARLGIEWDSRGWHGLIDAFDRDRQRDRETVLHGWIVLRFTWRDVHDRPTEVVRAIRSVLDRSGVAANRGL